MRLYSEHPAASIQMSNSAELRELLTASIRDYRITHVLESGTYVGTGSTTLLAECFPIEQPPRQFLTIEINWDSWRQAKSHLRRYPFIHPLWGRSVAAPEAMQFIASDDVLRNHHAYPDIFIDNIEDPVSFYIDELRGMLGRRVRTTRDRIRWLIDRVIFYAGENLLERYAIQLRHTKPLISLDSAGGIGFLEFSTVERVLKEHEYFLLLDDILHLKHFRSYRHVQRDPTYEILGVNEEQGWLLARHVPLPRA